MPLVKCPTCSHRWSAKNVIATGLSALERSKVKKKAMKDAKRRLKVDKAYEFMKDCEFAMNAVMAAMKAEECSKLNLAERLALRLSHQMFSISCYMVKVIF